MKLAILIPCYNESLTIAKVVTDFKKIAFPKPVKRVEIHVYDNNSSDGTDVVAREAGARLKYEYKQGKGNVIRSQFREIEADIYLMVDGDDTYPAEYAVNLVKPVIERKADIVMGDRHSTGAYRKENKRSFHNFGNQIVKWAINTLYKSNLQDILTGYRCLSRQFVKNFPIFSSGFSIETEMTLFALDRKYVIREIPIEYRDRPPGSFSKLNTFKDGIKVISTIVQLFKDYKPLLFFSMISMIMLASALLAGFPVINEYLETKYIKHIPLAILATGLSLVSIISLFTGFILDTVNRNKREAYELWLTKYEDNTHG